MARGNRSTGRRTANASGAALICFHSLIFKSLKINEIRTDPNFCSIHVLAIALNFRKPLFPGQLEVMVPRCISNRGSPAREGGNRVISPNLRISSRDLIGQFRNEPPSRLALSFFVFEPRRVRKISNRASLKSPV